MKENTIAILTWAKIRFFLIEVKVNTYVVLGLSLVAGVGGATGCRAANVDWDVDYCSFCDFEHIHPMAR